MWPQGAVARPSICATVAALAALGAVAVLASVSLPNTRVEPRLPVTALRRPRNRAEFLALSRAAFGLISPVGGTAAAPPVHPHRRPKADAPVPRSRNSSAFPGRREALSIAVGPSAFSTPDFCETRMFKQRLKERGCRGRSFVNRFCYGQCKSFFIPRLRRRLRPAFRSAAVCQPVEWAKVRVSLDCPGRPSQPRLQRTVMRVKRCSCVAIKAPRIS